MLSQTLRSKNICKTRTWRALWCWCTCVFDAHGLHSIQGTILSSPNQGCESTYRFLQQVVGKQTLGTIVKCFRTEVGFQGNDTNHSGKVTCATTLFNQNFDEQRIQHQTQTGHWSNAIRVYKRPPSSLRPESIRCSTTTNLISYKHISMFQRRKGKWNTLHCWCKSPDHWQLCASNQCLL